MNLSDINPKVPCLRILTSSPTRKRRISCSTNSKSTHSSSSSAHSKGVSSFPVLIQLCMYPDEQYAYETMKTLFASRKNYSPNVCDEFGCTALMYSLRYQRFRLFDFLLNEITADLNLRSKDQQGNTILHYAVIYGKDDTEILEKLIEKFNRFGITPDDRSVFGFTPLLLAIFCGRYDLALSLLTKTGASPFVRDHIQSKNFLDYLQFDIKHREFIAMNENNDRSHALTREATRLYIQLYKTLPLRSETSQHTISQHPHRNFFEIFFSRAVQDRTGLMRSLILQIFDSEHLSMDLANLTHYVNRRYPRITTPRRQDRSHERKTKAMTTTTTKFILQRENSKDSVHLIFNQFDPALRPKAMLPKVVTVPAKGVNVKAPTTFRRMGTKLTVLAALSRPPITSRGTGSITATGSS